MVVRHHVAVRRHDGTAAGAFDVDLTPVAVIHHDHRDAHEARIDGLNRAVDGGAIRALRGRGRGHGEQENEHTEVTHDPHTVHSNGCGGPGSPHPAASSA